MKGTVLIMEWYEILVQDRYISYFNDSNNLTSLCTSRLPAESVFAEFEDIVYGMTIACAMGNENYTEVIKQLAADTYKRMGY